MKLGRNLIRAKDSGKAWIKDRLPPIQPGGQNFSIDVTILLRNGGRTKAFYDYRENRWKSTEDYSTVINAGIVKGWRK